MPVAVPLVAAGIAAGATVYSVQQQKKLAEEARNVTPPELPKQAKVASFATDQQKAQALALTAGGTIFSDQKQNRAAIGSGPATGGKALLGA